MIKEPIFRNDRGFGYFVLVSGSHGHRKTRVWVHNTLVKEEKSSLTRSPYEFVGFPVKEGRVHQTEKGSLVLRPDKGVVYLVEIPSGYRGSAEITDVQGGEIVAQGHQYHSGQGALGETAWALVNAQEGPIEVFGRRSGRRVDNPEVAFRLTPDGEKEELVTDQEVCDLL